LVRAVGVRYPGAFSMTAAVTALQPASRNPTGGILNGPRMNWFRVSSGRSVASRGIKKPPRGFAAPGGLFHKTR